MSRVYQKIWFRHMWSHEGLLHRTLVRIYNRIMGLVPMDLKYRLGAFLRRRQVPYTLVNYGDTVLQIGAPRDTLLSGRARAVYFSLFVGPSGKVIVVEPDTDSVSEYRRLSKKWKLNNLILVESGAWNKKEKLRLYVDKEHPATNFTEGTKEYANARMQDYYERFIEVDTIDSLLEIVNVDHVDLVSITTNGAERNILDGMTRTMEEGVKHISLACTGEGYIELMKKYGYELLSYDDRGYTFINYEISGEK